MASTVSPYLVKLSHPVYPQRATVINAPDLTTAQSLAAARVTGSQWTVASVAPLVAQTQ